MNRLYLRGKCAETLLNINILNLLIMNKTELIEKIATGSGLQKADAKKVVKFKPGAELNDAIN